MKHKKLQVKVLRLMEKAMCYSIEKEKKSGPPICMGILHQPERPSKK